MRIHSIRRRYSTEPSREVLALWRARSSSTVGNERPHDNRRTWQPCRFATVSTLRRASAIDPPSGARARRTRICGHRGRRFTRSAASVGETAVNPLSSRVPPKRATIENPTDVPRTTIVPWNAGCRTGRAVGQAGAPATEGAWWRDHDALALVGSVCDLDLGARPEMLGHFSAHG
jgi:hypothetical protein